VNKPGKKERGQQNKNNKKKKKKNKAKQKKQKNHTQQQHTTTKEGNKTEKKKQKRTPPTLKQQQEKKIKKKKETTTEKHKNKKKALEKKRAATKRREESGEEKDEKGIFIQLCEATKKGIRGTMMKVGEKDSENENDFGGSSARPPRRDLKGLGVRRKVKERDGTNVVDLFQVTEKLFIKYLGRWRENHQAYEDGDSLV